MTIKPLRRDESKPFDGPSREEVLRAIDTILRHIGEDPAREGLRETPERVLRAWEEHFSGYGRDATAELARTFEEMRGYDDIVLVRDIEFMSHCEHHMVPIVGKAHVGYWPQDKIVGISKLARVVDIYSKRLICQENMTRRIAESIDAALAPRGVAVLIRAEHFCMSHRGVNKPASSTVTSVFTGIFKEDPEVRSRFLGMCA